MREILTDLETPSPLSDPDPVKRAQKQMRTPLPKRFYKSVEVGEADGGFRVLLDGKPVRTPGKAVVVLPVAEAAEIVRAEYDAQDKEVDPSTMPVTRLVNTAIDGVAQDPQAVAEDILRFVSSDLLCYRADGPEALVEKQREHWDPVLDWAERRFGGSFNLAEGVMHVEQPRTTVASVGTYLRERTEPLRICCLHLMTSLTGSALIALAVEDGHLTAEAAWAAAHVDEDWNITQWGEDSEAAQRRANRWRDMKAASDLLAVLP
ncbi:ATP12 family chaperone protein [Nitratireductor basaltis]|uniref:ATP12 ATPase n=1 Tax=Nitratireductor basaltis TaxID=472175 RepID=A0A084UAH3_9HYPH|nr:ATP12 family protein [Nitratireductor basaltis]KFB09959.1 ATP12 ATPase [Nitratireductor basaltis]